MFKKFDVKEKADSFIPYLATFYYAEIIYLMIFLNFLYGRFIAVISGILLTVFLTFHVIRLFKKNDLNRKIQLYLMDLHFAYSLAFIINRFISGSNLTGIDFTVIILRFMIALLEITAVFILTDKIIRKNYSDQDFTGNTGR